MILPVGIAGILEHDLESGNRFSEGGHFAERNACPAWLENA
jgi:hypothetical protein